MAFGLMLVLCVALLVGFRTRLVAPLLLCAFGYHYFLQLAVKESAFDRLIAIDLFVLCFADSGRVLGLSATRPRDEPLTVWPVRMLQLQTVLLYVGPGFWKLFTPGWHSGAVLASSLQGMWATPIAFAIARHHFSTGAWVAASWGVIGFELALGPLFVIRRTRPLAIALGTAFHLFNCLVLVIPEFLVSLVAYPVFIREATLGRGWDAVRSKLSRTKHAT